MGLVRRAIYRCEHCGQVVAAELLEKVVGDVIVAAMPMCARHEMPVRMVRREKLVDVPPVSDPVAMHPEMGHD